MMHLLHQDPLSSPVFTQPRGYARDTVVLDFISAPEDRFDPPSSSSVTHMMRVALESRVTHVLVCTSHHPLKPFYKKNLTSALKYQAECEQAQEHRHETGPCVFDWAAHWGLPLATPTGDRRLC